MNKKKHICFKKYTSKNCVISELQELQETSIQTARNLILKKKTELNPKIIKKNDRPFSRNKKNKKKQQIIPYDKAKKSSQISTCFESIIHC